MAYINKSGYVVLSRGILEHIEVAKANPEICGEWFEGCHVHHINGIKTDNRPENLLVLTNSEHMKTHMLGKVHTKEQNERIAKAKNGVRGKGKSVRIMQFDKEGNLIAVWDNALIASENTGVDFGNIRRVCRGERQTAGGYVWRNEVGKENIHRG